MRCGWCGSEDVSFETVDIGVGLQQVTPAMCDQCGAVEIVSCDVEPINPIDKKRGWYAGPDELMFVGPQRQQMPPVRSEPLRAWLCDFGTRVHVPWFNMVHVSYVEKVYNSSQFRTNCGLVFDGCELPPDNHITCLVCLTEETP